MKIEHPNDSILVTEHGSEPPMATPAACTVRVLDKNFIVYGYKGEGWFEQLAAGGTADGNPGYNARGLYGLIKRDSVCLDIGASYGLITLALAQLAPQGRIYAFEPDELSYRALLATLKSANYDNIDAYDYVIGKNNDRGRFVTDDAWRSSCHFIPDPPGMVRPESDRPICRNSRSIDGLELERVDFIKIDAEGSELDILQGAQETLQRCKPTVVMEFNSFALVYYRDIAPRYALEFIRNTFSSVRYFDRTQGNRLTPLRDSEAFLRANLLTGFVDDLVCN